jgi:hypothetical protein
MSQSPPPRSWQLTVSEIARAAYLCGQNPSASFRSNGQALGRHHSTIEEAADFGEDFASDEVERQAKVCQFIHWSVPFVDWSDLWSAEERIERSIILISILPQKTRKKVEMRNGFDGIH